LRVRVVKLEDAEWREEGRALEVLRIPETEKQGHHGRLAAPFVLGIIDHEDEVSTKKEAAGIDIGVVSVARPRDDIELPAWTDSIGEREGAVLAAGEMGLQSGLVRAGDRPFRCGGAGNGLKRGVARGLKSVAVVVEESHDDGKNLRRREAFG
jgi:hypothetical protein